MLLAKEILETNNLIDRRARVVDLFSFVGMTLTGILGVIAFFAENLALSASLITASIIYFAAYRIHRLQKDYSISAAVIVYSLHGLMIFLVYSGGVESTGPLWIFLVPPVSLFLHGLKRGLIEVSIFLAITSLIFFLPPDAFSRASYASAFELRLILAFMTVTFLSACYEYSIQQSYNDTLQASRRYEHLARTDPLTKLCNRRGALTIMQQEQRRMTRNQQPMSIILCDVDHFKKVNDQYGHDAGDTVLVRLGEIFITLVREQDTVARWGGEEFLFILPQTSAQNAAILAQKIHLALRDQTISVGEVGIAIAVSMGVAETKGDQAIDEIIKRADNYLYEAKDSGRNQTMPAASAG